MTTKTDVFPRPIFSLHFAGAYLTTMRPYLLFVSGITGIAGASFASHLPAGKALLIAAASFFSYGFGQALTDCFQIDTDSISAPYRPLTRGIISPRQVLTVSLIGLAACISIFSFFNPINLLLGAAAGVGLATYTSFKRRWWAGPFYNAWIVGLLFVMALLAGTGERAIPTSREFFMAMTTVFFGYANFVLAGYFKDITADRATGYNTLPVALGRHASAWVSDVFALSMSLSVLGLFFGRRFEMSSSAFWCIAFGILAGFVGQILLHRVRSDHGAHGAISLTVHSYILPLSGIALLQQPAWTLPLLLFYGGFVFTMKLRPAKDQI